MMTNNKLMFHLTNSSWLEQPYFISCWMTETNETQKQTHASCLVVLDVFLFCGEMFLLQNSM